MNRFYIFDQSPRNRGAEYLGHKYSLDAAVIDRRPFGFHRVMFFEIFAQSLSRTEAEQFETTIGGHAWRFNLENHDACFGEYNIQVKILT